ncbi:site-2 protease family protein [Anaerosporobacter sp.]
MREALLNVGAALVAGIVIMILHELPKSIIYCVRSRAEWKEQPNYEQRIKRAVKDIFKLWRYVDPIGLLLCVTTYSGFSKPYMYRMKDRETNKISGFVGFITLFLIAVVNIVILRMHFIEVNLEKLTTWYFYFFYFMAYISINMFIVNLIPITTFDMGLLVAGYSPSKYFSIIKSDHTIKMILLIAVLLGLISTISGLIMSTLLVIL